METMDTRQKIFITIGSIAAIFAFLGGAYFLTSGNGGAGGDDGTVYAATAEITGTDHTKWAENGPVVLTEYSDIQCPACANIHFVLKELEQDKDITDNVTLVYRHFPLVQAHPYAVAAAQAAEAAGEQGKFFEMLDLQFAEQTEWSTSNDPTEYFTAYATELELDIEQYQADYSSNETQDIIFENQRSGREAQVAGTPTFYLNGRKMTFTTVEDFQQQIRDEVERVTAEGTTEGTGDQNIDDSEAASDNNGGESGQDPSNQ